MCEYWYEFRGARLGDTDSMRCLLSRYENRDGNQSGRTSQASRPTASCPRSWAPECGVGRIRCSDPRRENTRLILSISVQTFQKWCVQIPYLSTYVMKVCRCCTYYSTKTRSDSANFVPLEPICSAPKSLEPGLVPGAASLRVSHARLFRPAAGVAAAGVRSREPACLFVGPKVCPFQ